MRHRILRERDNYISLSFHIVYTFAEATYFAECYAALIFAKATLILLDVALIFAKAIFILLYALLIFAKAIFILLDVVLIFAEAIFILLDAVLILLNAKKILRKSGPEEVLTYLLLLLIVFF